MQHLPVSEAQPANRPERPFFLVAVAWLATACFDLDRGSTHQADVDPGIPIMRAEELPTLIPSLEPREAPPSVLGRNVLGRNRAGRVPSLQLGCTPVVADGYERGRPIPIRLVTMNGVPVERATANAYWAMHQAAVVDGVELRINSAFRSAPEQERLYACYQCGCCNRGTKAAKPGYSRHQNGRAIDLSLRATDVHPWLVAHAADFGFRATVSDEPWHWEHDGSTHSPDVCQPRMREGVPTASRGSYGLDAMLDS